MYRAVAIIAAVLVVVLVSYWLASRVRHAESESASDVPKEAQQLLERARALQQKYWTPNPDEKRRFLERSVDELKWDETLRLLHLVCLDMISSGSCKDQLVSEELGPIDAPKGDNRELLVQLVTRLYSETSPYKPRHVAVWQGNAGESGKRKPDMQGVFRNASLTHLGCIEVIRLDAHQQPAELVFVPLDELRGAVFASPAMFRYARLFFDDGRPDEIVLAPIFYGISWSTPFAFDQDGTFTRFICSVEGDSWQALSVGVGHQDFVVEKDSNIPAFFGLSSVVELMIELSADDPKFDQKCRARGLDPATVRKTMYKE